MERNFFCARSLFVSCNAAFKPVYVFPGVSSSYVVQRETVDLMKPLQGTEDRTLDLDLTLSLKPPGTITKKCDLCGSTETPVWSSCCGNKVLCNLCGLEVRKTERKMSAAVKELVPMKRKYNKRGRPSIRGRNYKY